MSREIKFRAWADYGNGSGEMLPNIQNHINGSWAFGNILSGNIVGTEFSVMQFTGLKDKNGVEIYEGDIVQVESHGAMKVVFDVNMGGWYLRKDDYGIQWHEQAVRQGRLPYEVIGNIHENPELLNK